MFEEKDPFESFVLLYKTYKIDNKINELKIDIPEQILEEKEIIEFELQSKIIGNKNEYQKIYLWI